MLLANAALTAMSDCATLSGYSESVRALAARYSAEGGGAGGRSQVLGAVQSIVVVA